MGLHPGSSASRSDSEPDEVDAELDWPFGRIDSLHRSELRETAYELFFMSCRSSPGFGTGRGGGSLGYYSPQEILAAAGEGSPVAAAGPRGGTGMMVVTSRIKKALGLKARRSSPPMRAMSNQSGSAAGPNSPAKVKRPMTSAEIMRRQMRVTDQSDNRLRKTLVRTFVGQAGRRAETIILPLELLRQLKPSEFSDGHEYHQWQRRQLKVLEAGLLLHPSIPVERLNSAALRFREVMRSSEAKPIDMSKNSETMRTLCASAVSLAWRSPNTSPSQTCHWADGFPFNIHLYRALLHSIFDLKDETVVLDEVDELVELMKRTWSTLGINRMIHNVCFAWTLFHQYVSTAQAEPDLVCAALAMLVEVANDAKRGDCEPSYVKVLSATLTSMQGWAERKMLDYHSNFDRKSLGNMENILNLALSTTKIINEDVPTIGTGVGLVDRDGGGNRVDYYIRNSMRNAFTKILENGRHVDSMIVEVDEDPSEILTQLAKDTEALAMSEREKFSPALRRWHPMPAAAAVATLHNCFGIVLKQYLARVTNLTNELVRVLYSAGKLEKVLIQMVVEDSADCDDGGKGIVREMVPYEVDSIILTLLKAWIEERIRIGRECLNRAKETESWIPRSKTEPFAQSSVDLMKLAKVTVDEFYEIPVAARDDMAQDLADGLEALFQDYTSFVASCGSKQSYIPGLPSLTRCNQDSRLTKLWKKAAAPCKSGADEADQKPVVPAMAEGHHPRPSMSRGTQRLYIRLNTLHYLHSHLHSLEKSLSFFSRGNHHHHHGPSPSIRSAAAASNRRLAPTYHFTAVRSSIHSAIQHVSEVAAFRLIFLDSHHTFYDSLYTGDVADSRIRPALRTLKQNLSLLVSILTDRAQPLAVKEVMRATFEVFLMVLLAGGSERTFVRSDHEMVLEDFRSLRRVFCASGEGLVAEELVEREAEVVEGIVALMAQPTERLTEDLSIALCESTRGIGDGGAGERVPMPPTSGRWNRSDPNTVLRVLCHRNDEAADQFLKRTFQLPKRK